MDLTFSDSETAFRAECREWLEANVPRPALPSGDTAEGFALHREWERRLFDARWAVVSWPAGYGGRDASLWEWLIFEEEYARAAAPQRVTQNGIFLLAPTIFEFGTPEQQDRILPKMASGEEAWCQGWSEPNAGSDLAGIQARAVRDDAAGGWRLRGQKTWTTRGAFCDRLFGLFRTDPEAPRHEGLTYFLVDLRADGVTVRPVERLDGDDGFAEVFFDDAFVADADVLGDVGRGWNVAMATTGSERGLTLRAPGRFMAAADRLIDLARRVSADADAGPLLRDRVTRAWMDAQAYRWQTFWTVTRLTAGERPGAESSLVKLFWSELDVRLHETALALLGPHAELVDGEFAAWMKAYEFSLSGPIYAGTNEIQRNVVAERVLGLPREITMHFAFSDEQLALRDAVRDLLAKECPSAAVRAAWISASGRCPSAWAALTEMGVLGMMAPEAVGGLGLNEVDLVLVLEESGRFALPEPIVETAAVAVPLLAARGDDRAGALVSGSSAAVVHAEAPHAVWADTAACVVLLGASVWSVAAPGELTLAPAASVDGARHLFAVDRSAGLSWASVQAGDDADVDLAFDRAALGTAAQLVGLADRMIELTVAYASQRRQFGVPIGSFQAVKHHLANARLALEFARPLVYRAAWCVAEHDAERAVAVSLAKASASDAALLAGRTALQCHGAIGYTTEYDLHLFMKRAWALAATWGDAAWHRARVERGIL